MNEFLGVLFVQISSEFTYAIDGIGSTSADSVNMRAHGEI